LTGWSLLINAKTIERSGAVFFSGVFKWGGILREIDNKIIPGRLHFPNVSKKKKSSKRREQNRRSNYHMLKRKGGRSVFAPISHSSRF